MLIFVESSQYQNGYYDYFYLWRRLYFQIQAQHLIDVGKITFLNPKGIENT